MSQGEAELNDGAAGWPTLKAEMRLEEFMSRFEDPSATASPGASRLDGGDRDIRVAVWEIKAEQRAQQNSLNDLQRQIDLQRLATAELVGRSQSSASVLEKFEEVAQSTAAAAEQLEAETILVRSCCDSTRQATTKEIAAFRAELEESRGKHYADINALCGEFAGKGDAFSQRPRQALDSIGKPELTAMLEARDRSMRDQMTQALETAQAALSRNFLEEHRKLLVEVLEERESRVHEAHQMRARLDALLVAIQKGTGDGKSAEDNVAVNSQLDSMREAISQLRASIDEEGRGNSRQSNTVGSSLQGESQSDGAETAPSEGGKVGSRAATERFIFDSLATMRKDIASCLDAANAAVRLGEQLTNELNIEVDSRCSDVKALREWVCQVLEVAPSPEAYLVTSEGSFQNIDDPTSSPKDLRHPTNAISHSPFAGPRELAASSLNLALSKRGETRSDQAGLSADQKQMGQSMAALPRSPAWSSHHTLGPTGFGSQNLPLGTGAVDSLTVDRPGLRLSGGNPLTRRFNTLGTETMPAGDRYLASQRQASQQPWLGAAGSNGPVAPTHVGNSVGGVSPRQTRVQSPVRNYLMPRLDNVMTSQVSDNQLRRQQASSPVRDSHRDVLAPSSFAAHQATLQAAAAAAAAAGLGSFGAVGAGQPGSATVVPGLSMDSSRRMPSSLTLARSASPVQRRTSAV